MSEMRGRERDYNLLPILALMRLVIVILFDNEQIVGMWIMFFNLTFWIKARMALLFCLFYE